MDENEELKFLRKFKKEIGVGWGVGLVGVRVDVNAMWGGGDDVGYGGCEPRIEGIVQYTKRYCTILRKFKKCGGEGEGQYLSLKHSLCCFFKKKNKKVKKKMTEPDLKKK